MYRLWLVVLVVLLVGSAGFADSAKVARDVAGYYFVNGDDTGPYASASGNADALSILCPTWMGLKDSKGNIYAKEDPKLSAFAKERGIKLIPLIWGSDRKSMHALFTSIENRTRLVRNIADSLDAFTYCQGVNLDFENVDPKDRYSYNSFLLELSAKLKPKGYLVTIDVPAKGHEDLKNSWAGAFDYAEIGRLCDTVMIMAYDEHWSTSHPGPVASVQLDDVVLSYASTVIPKGKIFLGLPFYGYDWPAKGAARARRYTAISKLMKDNTTKLNWEREAKTPWFNYTDTSGGKRTLYFENKASIAAKLEIADRYDIGGICMWCLGDEDPTIWDAIREFRKS